MIEIVTHCYSGNLSQYAVFLRAQLSSLVLHPPHVKFRITLCYCPEDLAVVEVIKSLNWNIRLALKEIRLQKNLLFRRAIGRNLAATSTEADLIWFCDVDHVFGEGCLDDLWAQYKSDFNWPQKPVLVWPQEILVQSNFLVADNFWKAHQESKGLIEPHREDFIPKRYYKAIGGVQIVNGDFARKNGYLNGHRKWQAPAAPDKPFPSFRDDVAFRKFCQKNGGCLPIHLKNLYRLRHSSVTYRNEPTPV